MFSYQSCPRLRQKREYLSFCRTDYPSLLEMPNTYRSKLQKREYWISVCYELDVGDAGFAAEFGGEANPKFSPQELLDIQEVKLAHGIQ